MKKSKSIVLTCIVTLGVIAISANAGVYTLQPTPKDLYDLDHGHFYTWKIDDSIDPSDSDYFSLPSGETITGASLFFDNIENWDGGTNSLYISLLDGSGLADGTNEYNDAYAGHRDDNDIQNGYVLLHEYNLPASPQDKTYTFDSSEILTLNTYVLADGDFGIGFDGDCHYWNDGITLTIETAPVPVPAAVLLGILGLGVAGVKLRKYA